VHYINPYPTIEECPEIDSVRSGGSLDPQVRSVSCLVSFLFGWRIDSWSLCAHLDTTCQGSIIRVGLGTAKLVARL